MGALQREVNLIGERVEQSQIDIQECLKYHHPKLNDDDDWEFLLLFLYVFIIVILEQFTTPWLFYYTMFTFCPFVTKRVSIFCFGPGMYFQTSQFFVPNGQRGSLLVFYVGYILDYKNTFM